MYVYRLHPKLHNFSKLICTLFMVQHIAKVPIMPETVQSSEPINLPPVQPSEPETPVTTSPAATANPGSSLAQGETPSAGASGVSHRISEAQWTAFLDKIRANKQLALDPKAHIINRAYHETRMLAFASTFFKLHTQDESSGEHIPFCSFHFELTELITDPANTRLAIAAPRGHAKSTIVSFFYVIWAALYAKKRNIVIVSSSEDMAVRFLRRIKAELEHNKSVNLIFGAQKSDKWSETEIILQNGVTINARGRGAQLRGLISGSRRPDLIILDDIEDEELVRSEIRRSDLELWLNGTVMPTLSPKVGQLIFIGTILHQDSLLNNVLTNYDEYKTKKFAALLEDDTPLWPERFTIEMLHARRASYAARGQLAQFFMEYMNDPTPEATAFFNLADWKYYKPTDLPHSKVVEVAVDLGGGSTRRTADDTAMITGATDPVTGKLHILDVVSGKMGTDTTQVIEHLFRINEAHHPSLFIIEKTVATNFLMPTLTHAMQMKRIHLPIKLVTPPRGSGQGTGNMSDAKYQRIKALVQPVKMGDIVILPEHMKLVKQSADFPRGKHDDALDALAYLWMFGFKPAKMSKEEEDYLTHDTYQPLYDEIGL